MTLDQLNVLKTIVEQGSFRAASEVLHRAQSAVSYAVRELESEVGTKLFDRSQYRPQLTPAGQAVYQKALEVLREADQFSELAQILRVGVEPSLDLSVAAIFPVQELCLVLAAFAKKFPHTRLTLTSDVLGADRRLINSTTDMALAEATLMSGEIEACPCGTIAMWPVIASRYPMAKKIKDVLDPQLSRMPQIVVKSSVGGEDRHAGIVDDSQTWRVSDFATKLALIRSGLGWGRMPQHLIAAEVKSRQLIRLQDQSDYKVPIYLARHRHRVRGPAAQFLWDELKRRFESAD